jgi:hypothetical protein
MKGTEHIALPTPLILRGQKRFQLMHKWLEKRTGAGKKCTRQVFDLCLRQLIEISFANLDGYHRERNPLTRYIYVGISMSR